MRWISIRRGRPTRTSRPFRRRRICSTRPGSTRQPAGVVVTHKNVIANLGQLLSDYFEDYGNVPPPDTTVVSWLPFYHDMGLILGVFASRWLTRTSGRADESGVVPAETGPVDATAGEQQPVVSRLRRTSRSSWRCAGRRMTTWPGSTWVACWSSSAAANGFMPRRSRRFNERFSPLQPPRHGAAAVLRAGRGDGVRGVVGRRAVRRRRCVSTTRSCPPATRSAANRGRVGADRLRRTAVDDGAHRRSRDPDRESGRHRSARSGCTATTSPWVTGAIPQLTERTFGGQLVDPSPGTP